MGEERDEKDETEDEGKINVNFEGKKFINYARYSMHRFRHTVIPEQPVAEPIFGCTKLQP